MKTLAVNGTIFTLERCLNAWDLYYNGDLQLTHDTIRHRFQARCDKEGAWQRTPEEALADLRLPPGTPTKGAEPCEQPGESPGDSSPQEPRHGLLSELANELIDSWENPCKVKLEAHDPNNLQLSDIELAALATLVNDETLRLKQRAAAGETVDVATEASNALRDELRRRGVIGGDQ